MMRTRAALVTGGGRGIGRAITLALAGDGRSVAVADLLGDEAHAVAGEITKEGGSAVAVELDVTDPASVKGGVEIAESSLCAAWPSPRRLRRRLHSSPPSRPATSPARRCR
jgi:2-hydroxycyclohexanecarboxyl-CoA dehydrogenase